MENDTAQSFNPFDSLSSTDIMEELIHLNNIISSFEDYMNRALQYFFYDEENYLHLSTLFQEKLPHYKDKMSTIKKGLMTNYKFIKIILQQKDIFLQHLEEAYRKRSSQMLKQPIEEKRRIDRLNEDKVISTLKQIARDWSLSGETERKECYQPFLDELIALYPYEQTRSSVKILVPGCGLGRLPYELAKLGFNVEGNEFSYHMLMVSHLLLNYTTTLNAFTIHPYLHNTCNNLKMADQLLSITFPDVNPRDIPENASLSMVAGEFEQVYNTPDHFQLYDIIITCFFIDTSHNILSYLKTISSILKPKGLWINLGPLLYHYHDMSGEESLEISFEEILQTLPSYHFEILHHRSIPCHYCYIPNNLLELYNTINRIIIYMSNTNSPRNLVAGSGSALKEGLFGLLCGIGYGVTSPLVGHPLDTLKTRMQAYPKYQKSGTIQVLTSTIKNEGISGLYRGLMFPLIGSTIYRSSAFMTYGTVYGFLRNHTKTVPYSGGLEYRVAIAGIMSGLFRSFLETPLEYMKVRRQVNQRWQVERTSRSLLSFFSPYNLSRQINQCYRGLSMTTYRNMGLMGTFFIFVDYSSRVCPSLMKNPLVGGFVKGSVCSTLSWFIIWPLDTLKSRVQSLSSSSFPNSKQLILHILRSEGIRGLYRGFVPGMMRPIITNGFAMMVYTFLQSLRKN